MLRGNSGHHHRRLHDYRSGRRAQKAIEGIAVNAGSIFTYIGAQMIGAFIGAVLCWLAYKKQFDQEAAPALKPVSYTHLTLPTNREV